MRGHDGRIETALRHASDTREVLIGSDVLSAIDAVVGRGIGDAPVIVVADETTWQVAGKQVQQHLEAAVRATAAPYLFPADVYAGYENVEPLRQVLQLSPAVPVAVGSGTVNDLVKRAAHELGRPYVTVATAASMDGYAAFGASLSKDGYKQTMECAAPRALLADVDVLIRAPARMTASGYGDLLGKVTAGADWLIADALDVEAIDPDVWSLVQGPLRDAIGRPDDLAAGDPEAVHNLLEGLIMSGLAMQAYASSRPGSGAEHQFSHLWEMTGLGHDQHPPLSHGFKVAVGSVAVAALYERLLERDPAAVDVHAVRGGWPTREELRDTVTRVHAGTGIAAAAVTESLAKHLDDEALTRRLTLLRDRWPDLRARLLEQLLPADRLTAMLRAAGCPTHPAEIGLTTAALRDTYDLARTIRRRYTVLDLAVEARVLHECVGELFSAGGFWGAAA